MSEQWVVSIDRKEFIVNGEDKVKILEAMSQGKRYVMVQDGSILSVRRISYIYLHSKVNEKQLQEGEKYSDALPKEEAEKRIKEIRSRFKR